jgi:hypothetical protein
MPDDSLKTLIADAARGLTDDALEKLVTALLASRCTPEAAALARDHGWKPIIEAAIETRSHFRRDYEYSIDITRSDDPRFYAVLTTLEMTRKPPSNGAYVKFGRTAMAISEGLDEDELLAAELVPVNRNDWDSDDVRSALSTDVVLDKTKHLEVGKPEDHGPDTYRLAVTLPALEGDGSVSVEVKSRYLVPRSLTYFPVKLADVYLYGETEISLRIDDPEVDELEAWVSLSGDVHREPNESGVRVETEPSGQARKIRVATTSRVLLWPGTAVMFVWRRVPAT